MALNQLNRGFIVQISIPDSCTMSLADLTQLANNTGFPLEFLPKEKQGRNAFELSFNILGKRGMLVDARMDVRKRIWGKYQVEPIVRIEHKVSSSAAPILRRTLVEVRRIPFANADDGKVDTKAEYIKQVNVAVLEYDTETDTRNATFLVESESWVDKGTIQNVVNKIKDRHDAIQNNCVASDIRNGLRDFLISRKRIQLGGFGIYYIPERSGMAQELSNMQDFVRGMGSFCSDKPIALIFQVAPWDDKGIADIKQASINDLSEQLFTLKREIMLLKKPTDDDSKKQYDKQMSRLLGRLAETKETINTVKLSLAEDMSVLEMVYDSCKSVINKKEQAK